ncbi:hypothetical protein [Streptomyces sp. 900105245]
MTTKIVNATGDWLACTDQSASSVRPGGETTIDYWARFRGQWGAEMTIGGGGVSFYGNTTLPWYSHKLMDGTSVVTIGRDNARGNLILFQNVRESDGSWQGGRQFLNFGALSVSIAAVARRDAQTEDFQVVCVGWDGNVYHTLGAGSAGAQTWANFAPLDGYGGAGRFSGPDVQITGMPNGEAQVVAIGIDSKVYHNIRRADGSWQGWIPIPNQDGLATKVSIAGIPDGSAHVAILSDGGKLLINTRRADGGWSGWMAVPGTNGADSFMGHALSIAAITGDATVQLLATDTQDGVWYTTRRASGWGEWSSIGQQATVVSVTGMPGKTNAAQAVLVNGKDIYHTTNPQGGPWDLYHSASVGPGPIHPWAAIAGKADGTAHVLTCVEP